MTPHQAESLHVGRLDVAAEAEAKRGEITEERIARMRSLAVDVGGWDGEAYEEGMRQGIAWAKQCAT